MSSIWNNRLHRIIAPFWCEKDTVLHPDLPKEQKPTPARHLNSRFLVLFLSLVPSINYKRSAKCRIPPYCRPPTPSRLCLREGGLAPPQVFPRLRGEYGTSEKHESWTQRGAQEGYNGNEGRTQAGNDWKEKERKVHFFCPSHHAFRLLSLTINSNTVSPTKWSRTTGDKAGEGGGGVLYMGKLDQEV